MPNCKVCKLEFEPRKPLQRVCTLQCGIIASREDRKSKAEKRFDAETRRRKKLLKNRAQYTREAQASFNKFIRLRDGGLPCISCGATTGQMQAGHYRPTSTQSALRFNEIQVRGQCSTCNMHLSGNLIGYRKGLVALVGEEMVAFLDGDHPPAKWTIDELRWIKVHYHEKAREIEAGRPVL